MTKWTFYSIMLVSADICISLSTQEIQYMIN